MTGLRSGRPTAHLNYSLVRESDGEWRISTEALTIGGLYTQTPITVEHLVAVLDTAGIRRATVLSLAYQFGSGAEEGPEEYGRVQAENDWTVAQAARFPQRLTAFCSFNPLRGYALREAERCAGSAGVRGIERHFGNSSVDLTDPQHVASGRSSQPRTGSGCRSCFTLRRACSTAGAKQKRFSTKCSPRRRTS